MGTSYRCFADFEESLLNDFLNTLSLYDVERAGLNQAVHFLKSQPSSGKPVVDKIELFHYLRNHESSRSLLRGEEPKAMEYFMQILHKWQTMHLVRVITEKDATQRVEFLLPDYDRVLQHYLRDHSGKTFQFPLANKMGVNKRYSNHAHIKLADINLASLLQFSKRRAIIELDLESSRESILFPSRSWPILLQNSLHNVIDHFKHSQFRSVFQKAINNLRGSKDYQSLNENALVEDLQRSMTAFSTEFYSRFFFLLADGLTSSIEFPERNLLEASIELVRHGLVLRQETQKEQKRTAERDMKNQEFIHFLSKQTQPLGHEYLKTLYQDGHVKKIYETDSLEQSWPSIINGVLKKNLLSNNSEKIRASTLIPVMDNANEAFIMAGHLIKLVFQKIDKLVLQCKTELIKATREHIISGEPVPFLYSEEHLEYKLEEMLESEDPLISFLLHDSVLFRRLILEVLSEYERPKLVHQFFPNEKINREPLIKAFKMSTQLLMSDALRKLSFFQRIWYQTILRRDQKVISPDKMSRSIQRPRNSTHVAVQDLTLKEALQSRYLRHLKSNSEIASSLEKLKESWNGLTGHEASSLTDSIHESADAVVFLNSKDLSSIVMKELQGRLDSAIANLVRNYDKTIENGSSLRKYLEIYICSALIDIIPETAQ